MANIKQRKLYHYLNHPFFLKYENIDDIEKRNEELLEMINNDKLQDEKIYLLFLLLTDNKRNCFICNSEYEFQSYFATNYCNFKGIALFKYWLDKRLQFLCCSCKFILTDLLTIKKKWKKKGKNILNLSLEEIYEIYEFYHEDDEYYNKEKCNEIIKMIIEKKIIG